MSAAKLIAIAVVQHGDEVLIGLRPEGVPLAGFWEFPGGKVHDGEQPAAAAVRECLEETGVSVRVLDEFPAKSHDYEHGSVHLRCFACEPEDPTTAPRGTFRWVKRASLGDYAFPEANEELIRQLVEA